MPADECTPIEPDRAVVDRIVDDTAVVLVGPDEAEHHLPASELPEGASEGSWLVVDPASDPVGVLGVDEALTQARTEALTRRLDRIRRQRTGGRFGRR